MWMDVNRIADWTPITEADIWDLINESYKRMTPKQRRIWEVIKVSPQKWSQEPYGNEGGDFWIVAIIGIIASGLTI